MSSSRSGATGSRSTPRRRFRGCGQNPLQPSGAPATVTPLPGGAVKVKLHAPQRAITPGQAAVFYQATWCWAAAGLRAERAGRPNRRTPADQFTALLEACGRSLGTRPEGKAVRPAPSPALPSVALCWECTHGTHGRLGRPRSLRQPAPPRFEGYAAHLPRVPSSSCRPAGVWVFS